ncbi:putative glycoside hydrolase [Oceanobacillus limi]|nr:putative glycoside hydrolase [Oceanobacillus limi]
MVTLLLITGCTNNLSQNESEKTPSSFDNTTQKDGDNQINNLSNKPKGDTDEPGEADKIDEIEEQENVENETEEKKDVKKQEKPNKRDVRGIYLNRNSIKEENVDKFINMVKSSNLNAVVIDVKDDYGKLTYDSEIDLANEIGSDTNPSVSDLEALINRFKEEDIYTIARIVTFKDPYLAEHKTDVALKRKDGSVWSDKAGTKWIDPYKKEVWEYVTDIAAEVSAHGIDEIQYDYIRFPENAKKVDQEVAFDNPNNTSKSDLITNYLEFSNEKLQDHPVYVSADVFGLVTSAGDDMGIGQKWEKISPLIDYISPMTYPSHYAPNSYGIDNPNDHPYDLMTKAMEDAIEKNKQLKNNGKSTATIRPWIQDFDLKRTYTEKDVRDQIKALTDQDIQQYLVWNAGNKYTESAFN